MSEERRMDTMLDKLTRFWPIAAVLVAGISGYINLQISVSNLRMLPAAVELLKERVLILETKLAYVQMRKRRQIDE